MVPTQEDVGVLQREILDTVYAGILLNELQTDTDSWLELLGCENRESQVGLAVF